MPLFFSGNTKRKTSIMKLASGQAQMSQVPGAVLLFWKAPRNFYWFNAGRLHYLTFSFCWISRPT